jgi:hypothetical protein
MKTRLIIIALYVLLGFNIVIAMPNPSSVYCADMGYILDLNGTCIFPDGTSCPEWDFFRGECGSQYVKEIPCRKIGESIITSFEKCCEGYAYAPKYLIGQVTCQPLSKIIIDNFKYNPVYWVGTLAVLGAAAYLICKKSRKSKKKGKR